MSDSEPPTISAQPTSVSTNQETLPPRNDSTASGSGAPVSIGRYRILRLLGEGGMGAVYEAEQDQPRRLVALKIIKAPFASPELLRRFERESEALGRLHHPGIAQIFEAGYADSSFGVQPFFAMELIQGKPLVEYSAELKLNVRGRLNLMIQICEAVQHAHQRGIIHRDLKPGNILVNEHGQPKILDFGLARATDSDTQATRQTDMGQLLGTLPYMSPEQVLADPLALDTRSDVYSLGVILYELLAGKLPYVLPRSLHEAVRTIQETEPKQLGTVNRLLRGDIETIAAKALEKDKNRRYASANGLAADIRRYLDDQPISAKPASASYQLKKFARRHRALVAGVAAAAGILVLGLIASTWEAIRARAAEARAIQQSAIAQAVNDFLRTDLLSQASAYNQNTRPDPNLTVRTALDRAAARVEGRFGGQPLVEASVRYTIGSAYIDLGLYPEAERQLERSLALRSRGLGDAAPDTLVAMASLAAVYERNGQLSQAESLYSKVVDLRKRTGNNVDGGALLAMNGLAVTYAEEGRYQESQALFERVVPLEKNVFGENNLQTLRAMGNLAATYDVTGQHEKAKVLLLETLDRKRKVLGEENPETLDTISNLAELYKVTGDYARAEPLLTAAVAAYQRVLGTRHQLTIAAKTSLADLERIMGKTAAAEKLIVEALSVSQLSLGESHPRTMDAIAVLGETYADAHRDPEAEKVLTQAVELRKRAIGPEHPDTLDSMTTLARVLLTEGKYSKAEATARETLSGYERAMPDSWQLYLCRNLLGASLAGQKKSGDAESQLVSGYEGLLKKKDTIDAPSRFNIAEASARVVRFYRQTGREDEASKWSEKIAASTSR
jgi:eukaryotic-like serine/threonine-protein kinase